MPELRLREYSNGDATGLLLLFRDTIRRVNIHDYSADQVAAWSADEIDLKNWTDRFMGRKAFVIAEGSSIVGFVDMTCEGHLDRLFVSADHQRQGIATMLVKHLISVAIDLRLPRIRTESSITAEPFFRSLGFEVVREQTVELRGQTFVNYPMELHLNRS